MKKISIFLVVVMLLSSITVFATTNKDLQFDIVVVGAGGAGLAAANQAVDLGAEVLLVEKMSFAGGATLLASGSITATGSKLQAALGMEPVVEEFLSEHEAEATVPYDPELAAVHAKNSGRAIDFMIDLGVEFQPDLSAPPYRHQTKDPYMFTFIDLAKTSFLEKGGQLMLNTRATALLVDDNGAVNGIKAINPEGNEVKISAKSVILATGDYGANKELLPTEFHSLLNSGPAASTGDGIIMAQAIGADVMNMDKAAFWANGIEGSPGQAIYTWGRLLCQFGGIYVNSDGERFSKDVMNDEEAATSMFAQEMDGKQVWVIYDQTARDALNDFGFPSVVSVWSASKEQDELTKNQSIWSAESISELAEKIGVSKADLTNTVDTFNSYVEAQADPDFGRPEFASPLNNPPYYALTQRISIYPTIGGLKIDAEARVINTSGDPILGLYAAGDITGEVSTNGRDTLVPAIAFGLVAAENAVANLE